MHLLVTLVIINRVEYITVFDYRREGIFIVFQKIEFIFHHLLYRELVYI
jgi:hypothetical protein